MTESYHGIGATVVGCLWVRGVAGVIVVSMLFGCSGPAPFNADASSDLTPINDVRGIDVTDALEIADASPGFDATTALGDTGDANDVTDSAVATNVRLLAPLSTATVTSQQPTLRWRANPGSTGVHVEICADPMCVRVEQTLDATTGSGVPATALAHGVHFWHARDVASTAYSPLWQFAVGSRSAGVNTSWGTYPDVNGDGLADILVESGSDTYVYLGTTAGPSSTRTTLTGPMYLQGPVASAGDVNGDGFPDIIVGGLGIGAIYLGGASGPRATPIIVMSPLGAIGFGATVTSAGDINADGYGDVIIGSGPYEGGSSWIYLGSATGVSPMPMRPTDDGGTYAFGGITVSAGDTNGDGLADVVSSGLGAAEVRLFLGSATGLSVTYLTLPAPPSVWSFAPSFAATDVNGDGFADLVIGTGSQNFSVYLGSTSGVITPSNVFTGPVGGAPSSVTNAGDIDGDGFGDVLVAGSGASAVVYLGRASGNVSMPYAIRAPAYTSFEGSIAGAGDIDGDGFDDLVLSCGGSVCISPGNATLPLAVLWTLTDSGGSLGTSVADACDLPYRSLAIAYRGRAPQSPTLDVTSGNGRVL